MVRLMVAIFGVAIGSTLVNFAQDAVAGNTVAMGAEAVGIVAMSAVVGLYVRTAE